MTNADAACVHLTIDGRSAVVEAGSTVAAALVVAGVSGTRTSVSGQPRAALCGMGVCQECRVMIDGRAHALACQILCREGQVVWTTAATASADAANVASGTNVANGTNVSNGTNRPNGTTTTGTR
ncbi:(2Fe-2S)-binding protein [Paraburkholderia sp. 5N]|uniref:(2Fe-2S)-binding protein n=1 Tax=Paraburkholderia elongata TaxID=2675747 RepID=A0A972NMA3_9BURK|nr:2Fe-2S iron-sulfur cluster-binding protein [Paraburkholderia elongata]NPT54155.1 (2Fe-2S)-binding protein [Paraburkholderia elongata]